MTRMHALQGPGGVRRAWPEAIHDRSQPFDLPLTHNSPKRCARAGTREGQPPLPRPRSGRLQAGIGLHGAGEVWDWLGCTPA